MKRALSAWLLLCALSPALAAAQETDALTPDAAPEAKLPGYSVGSVALSLGLTAAGTAAAAGGALLFLKVKQECDAQGDLAALGCQDFVLPFVGLAGVAGLGAAALAPSAGHYYAGAKGRARLTAGIRMGGAVLVALGVQQFAKEEILDGKVKALVLGGGIPMAALSLFDIVDGGLAKRRLAKRAREKTLAVTLSPAPMPDANGVLGVGLLASGSF
jgi:hypothetical protein